jgi:phosphate:Na+ symporter
VLIDMLGAGALLIWGLRMIQTSVLQSFGARLRYVIGVGTRNRPRAFLTGLGATFALQSSTATALMVASFAAGDLIGTALAQAVMLGANVGTSILTQILAFDIHWLSPALILIGVTLHLSRDASRLRAMAQAIVGLGLMLLSLQLLAGATEPMRSSPVISFLFAALADAPVLAVIAAALIAVLCSSSLAVVLLTMSLAANGHVPPALGIALVLGANIGGAVPPLLATSALGPAARRVTVGNFLIRLFGSALALLAMPWAAAALSRLSADPSQTVVNAHLLFNIGLAVLFLPLLGPFSALITRGFPSKAPMPGGPRYLDEKALATPAVALACAARETLRVADRVEAMLSRSLEALRGDDEQLCAELIKMDNEVDDLHESIKLYLAKLGRGPLTAEEQHRSQEITSFVINLEHIGDIIDKSFSELIAKKIRKRLRFSDEGFAEITAFHRHTLDNLRMAQSIFLSRDVPLARRLVELKVEVRNMERISAEHHMARLREGRVESVQTSSLHLDLLRDLKRINAHIASVAYPLLDASGELAESRLR